MQKEENNRCPKAQVRPRRTTAPSPSANAKPPVRQTSSNVKARDPQKAPPSKVKPKPVKRPTKKQRAEQKQQSRQALNARIKTQTPTSRNAIKEGKRINGSIKNLEIKRRVNTKKQQFHVKKKKNPMRRIILLGLVLFFIIFAILFGILALYISLDINSGEAPEGEAYTLQIGMEAEEDEDNLIELSEDVAQRDDILYIPVSALSEMCNFTVTGMSDDLRYIVRDDDSQNIRFIVGSNLAYINTCKVRLSGNSFINDGMLYVPLDFFSSYAEGLTVNVDSEENLITIYRNVVGKDEYLRDIYEELRFRVSKQEALSVIPVPEDVDPDPVDDTDSANSDF